MTQKILVGLTKEAAEAFSVKSMHVYTPFEHLDQILKGGDIAVSVIPGAEARDDFNRIKLAMKATGRSFVEIPKEPVPKNSRNEPAAVLGSTEVSEKNKDA